VSGPATGPAGRPGDPAEPGRPGDAAGPTPAGEPSGPDGPDEDTGAAGRSDPQAAARRREHAVRGTLAAALCLEALTVLFVPRTIARVGDDGLTGIRLTLILVLAGALLVAAGLQRFRAGRVLGSVLQVAVVATGVMVSAMYFLGLLFAGVWAYVLWVRREINRAAAGAPGGESAGSTA